CLSFYSGDPPMDSLARAGSESCIPTAFPALLVGKRHEELFSEPLHSGVFHRNSRIVAAEPGT
ncbi:MAG TPA: hypothetical protein VFE08_02390, partial [Candidatus Sulfotelmatobacter sp.]|nr:hypothetical protein [Candidatus Sulfotelmatobacter sp.]